MSCKLNGNYSKIHDVTMGNGVLIRRKDHFIQHGSYPMNNLYWEIYREDGDRAIGVDNFKFVDYEDSNMINIKPFKKSR